ncbi:hypothetical protein SAICODRAFT_158706 [Saitoella complicata NRRL Y-17804]|uniref:uncharacterized protein n=1 Tax=Saitoella complicata (strain BCRC 22490 / CBS 7301 / JCM 7358 / NBRC 10748 / NRRL Y-17804) TaxID=698492 RepID=UPI0008678905|nr:uncharacterized protein SAICODRAFT_158706 [Saitoella complicata NRRL Y-17804]ODQ51193.1 hypothetical protein SAICODRAFT_158706 [Saitoella complicata NRRL Y-17804]
MPSARLQAVQELINVLANHVREGTVSSTSILPQLQTLKVLGREPSNCGPICAQIGISTLKSIGLPDGQPTPSSLEALRCLANALLLHPPARVTYVEEGGIENTLKRYEVWDFIPLPIGSANSCLEQSADIDEEFLLGRILFLVTASSGPVIGEMMERAVVQTAIVNHLERASETDVQELQMAAMALAETLKLLFNLAKNEPERVSTLQRCTLPPLLRLLRNLRHSSGPPTAPLSHVIDALFGLTPSEAVYQRPENVKRMIDILDLSLRLIDIKNLDSNTSATLDKGLTPLLGLLNNVASGAPEDIREYIKSRLLPSTEERKNPLGKGDGLNAKMIQLMGAGVGVENVKECVGGLLYGLSDSNATKFIQNIGYGNAAGFLLNHGIATPALSDLPQSSSESVNPITGQLVSEEEKIKLGDMTDEEKEREAERLFVLFERLRKTGVVDVQNPIREAVESGRLSEM